MIGLLIFSICVSLFCLGVYVAVQFEGMILSFVPEKLWLLPELLQKILYDCLPCMSSFWSLFWWFIIFPLSWKVIFCIFMSCGINFIFGILTNYYELQRTA